ncbi:MAG TPA: ABC transporter permease subunit [Pirellulales bacterium]|jgi:ABC-2 type transport system permease protein
MNRTLLTKAFGDGKWLLLALALLMFGFAWQNIWISSMVSLPAFSEFITHALPKQWEKITGVSFAQVATTAGRVALVFVQPLIVYGAAVWAIARGSDCVSGEIGRGSMELLLAQPVRRSAIFFTQAAATIFGSAVLAIATWCGITMALLTVKLPDKVSPLLYIPPTINLFGEMVCVSGIAALVSSWGSQRWRSIGVATAIYVVSTLMTLAGNASDQWHWLTYISFISASKTQSMVARPEEVWSLLAYHDGVLTGIGLGGLQLVFLTIGIVCYIAGAMIFNRREIPAPV